MDEEKVISFMPRKDVEYLKSKQYQFNQVLDGNTKCLIIDNYPLPEGKYNYPSVQLLIVIPDGYNDTHPDMFFCNPHLILTATGSEPAATNGRVSYHNIQWQQWSRHSNLGNDWRAGIDGIMSHLRKVDNALQIG